MKNFSAFMVFFVVFTFTSTQFGVWEGFVETADEVHNYEYKSLALAKEKNFLRQENDDLKSQVLSLKAKNEHLALSQSTKKNIRRNIASVGSLSGDNDLVQFDVYNWSAEKLLDVAEQSFFFKKYNKSSQFYGALMKHYPNSELVTAEVIFNAGVSSFEMGGNYKHAIKNFEKLAKTYPASKFARGAKLWLALSYHKTGRAGRFMASVDEFRMKYRNTKEWKVLSRYYEDIAFKYKK